MALYKARKGNEEFSIQPNMIEPYSLAGYEIIRMEEVVVCNIKNELSNIETQTETAKIGGNIDG